jgi:peptidyl-prolyl cis-trans isomerase C
MQRTVLALALMASLSLSSFAADTATAPDAPKVKSFKPDEPIAKVNGVDIPAIYAEFVRQNRAARNLPQEMLSLEAVRDSLVASELLVQEAIKKGLDKNPNVSAAIEFQRREFLGKAALDDFARHNPVSEELVKAEYDKAKAKAGTSEYRPRHILVPTEKEARALIAKLTTGKKAKFEDLAKSSSKDSSAGNGGDLGWILPANLVPEFAEAMTKLKKGEITKQPVQTQFGWHVIKLEDSRTLDFPAYDKLKGRIASQMQQMQMRKFVQELRATSKVE